MKKLIIITVAAFAFVHTKAQSEKFEKAMQESLAQVPAAFNNAPDLLSLANKFERIAMAEKNQWLPYYYAAYCQINYAFVAFDPSKADGIADKATSLLNKADSLQPNNSEISCIKSMIATAHLIVDPAARYMEYGPQGQAALEAAMKQDPSNPRPHLLMGQDIANTPEQYGGGCSKALPHLEAAKSKFEAFKPASGIAPNWGAEYNQQLIERCKK